MGAYGASTFAPPALMLGALIFAPFLLTSNMSHALTQLTTRLDEKAISGGGTIAISLGLLGN